MKRKAFISHQNDPCDDLEHDPEEEDAQSQDEPSDTIYIKTQIFRLLRYYSPAPRNIDRSDWATQNITHNMTSSIT